MEHYEHVRIRMDCLTLAHRDREGWDPEMIIRAADELVKYVLEEQIPQAPSQPEFSEIDGASQAFSLSPHQNVRDSASEMRRLIDRLEDSREKSMVVTKLDELLLWLEADRDVRKAWRF